VEGIEDRCLLSTAVLGILNQSNYTLTFGFRWTPSSAWAYYTESPGQGTTFSTGYSNYLSPQALYNTTTSSGSQTTINLSQAYNLWSGTGTPPASVAKPYAFENTSTGVQLYYVGGSTAPATNPTAIIGPNWSGYVAETNLAQPQLNSVTAVSGSWILPSVSGPSNAVLSSGVWVGIDGANNGTVEQIGTAENVIYGHPQYYAWWEMYSSGVGQPGQPINMTIMPGDSISASVQYMTSDAHAGQFLLSIVDNSRANDYFYTYASSSQYQYPLAQRSSAEWIVEAPTSASSGSIQKLPNFGSVTFTNASAVINGIQGPINSPYWQSQALDIGSNGILYDATSILTNAGTSFVVTYNPSAGAALRVATDVAAGKATGTAMGTSLRSSKTIDGHITHGSAWKAASTISGFRAPVRQHKHSAQGLVLNPLWN
jgi:hypothetical protein